MDSSLLSAGCSPIPIVADQIGFQSGPMPSFGSTSRPARSSPTSPSSRISPGRPLRRSGALGNLLLEPLVQRLVLPLADQLRVALGRVALVEHIVDAAIDQGSLWLELVQLLGLVGDLVRVLAHVASLP